MSHNQASLAQFAMRMMARNRKRRDDTASVDRYKDAFSRITSGDTEGAINLAETPEGFSTISNMISKVRNRQDADRKQEMDQAVAIAEKHGDLELLKQVYKKRGLGNLPPGIVGVANNKHDALILEAQQTGNKQVEANLRGTIAAPETLKGTQFEGLTGVTRGMLFDFQDKNKPKTIKGADGYNYYTTGPKAGQRVLPGVVKTPNDKPTNSKRKYEELLALGVPDNVAQGVSYGTIRQISGWRGTALVDIGSGRQLEMINLKGNYIPNKQQSTGKPQSKAPQSAIDFLKAHPETKTQFKKKFGYLP